MWVVTWFFGTRLGRWFALAGAVALALGIALLRARSSGRAAAEREQERQALDSLRSREATRDEIARLPAAERRKRLSEWVLDDDPEERLRRVEGNPPDAR